MLKILVIWEEEAPKCNKRQYLLKKKPNNQTYHPMMNLLFGTHGFWRLQARSLIHCAPPGCFRQSGFKAVGLLRRACGFLSPQPLTSHMPTILFSSEL